MTKFANLEPALEGHFDKPFAKLPAKVRQHAGMRAPKQGHPAQGKKAATTGERDIRAFCLMSWDSLSPRQRRVVARQWDFKNDPTHSAERQRSWDLEIRRGELEQEIMEWEQIPTRWQPEKTAKERRLKTLRGELTALDKGITVAPIRKPGRPSPRALIDAELARRIAQRTLEKRVAVQARVLQEWLAAHHGDEPQVTADTIEINIRAEFNRAKREQQK